MKKIISLMLAVCILLSVNITAFAKADSDEDIMFYAREASANYIDENDNVSEYTAEDCIDLFTLVRNKDMSEYAEGFYNSVTENLAENNGDLMVYGEKSITAYALVLYELNAFKADGLEVDDSVIATLEKNLLVMDTTAPLSNPYFYRSVIPALVDMGYDQFAYSLAETLTDRFYRMGTGMSYYPTGSDYDYFGCDNTASYVIAVAPFYDDFKDEINDALNLLKQYKTTGGYCSDPYDTMWGGNIANTDSTALVTAAYSAASVFTDNYNYVDKANEAFEYLAEFATDNVGEFSGTYDPVISTKDALIGLEGYTLVVIKTQDDFGWKEFEGKKYYIDSNGDVYKGLHQIDKKNYIFSIADCYMLTGKVRCAGKYYIMSKSNGEMLYGKVRCDGKYYIMSKTNGEMLYGKVRCDGKQYIMSKSNGTMLYGKVTCDGKTYICSKADGHVFVNQRVTCDGKPYYCDANGVAR